MDAATEKLLELSGRYGWDMARVAKELERLALPLPADSQQLFASQKLPASIDAASLAGAAVFAQHRGTPSEQDAALFTYADNIVAHLADIGASGVRIDCFWRTRQEWRCPVTLLSTMSYDYRSIPLAAVIAEHTQAPLETLLEHFRQHCASQPGFASFEHDLCFWIPPDIMVQAAVANVFAKAHIGIAFYEVLRDVADQLGASYPLAQTAALVCAAKGAEHGWREAVVEAAAIDSLAVWMAPEWSPLWAHHPVPCELEMRGWAGQDSRFMILTSGLRPPEISGILAAFWADFDLRHLLAIHPALMGWRDNATDTDCACTAPCKHTALAKLISAAGNYGPYQAVTMPCDLGPISTQLDPSRETVARMKNYTAPQIHESVITGMTQVSISDADMLSSPPRPAITGDDVPMLSSSQSGPAERSPAPPRQRHSSPPWPTSSPQPLPSPEFGAGVAEVDEPMLSSSQSGPAERSPAPPRQRHSSPPWPTSSPQPLPSPEFGAGVAEVDEPMLSSSQSGPAERPPAPPRKRHSSPPLPTSSPQPLPTSEPVVLHILRHLGVFLAALDAHASQLQPEIVQAIRHDGGLGLDDARPFSLIYRLFSQLDDQLDGEYFAQLIATTYEQHLVCSECGAEHKHQESAVEHSSTTANHVQTVIADFFADAMELRPCSCGGAITRRRTPKGLPRVLLVSHKCTTRQFYLTARVEVGGKRAKYDTAGVVYEASTRPGTFVSAMASDNWNAGSTASPDGFRTVGLILVASEEDPSSDDQLSQQPPSTPPASQHQVSRPEPQQLPWHDPVRDMLNAFALRHDPRARAIILWRNAMLKFQPHIADYLRHVGYTARNQSGDALQYLQLFRTAQPHSPDMRVICASVKAWEVSGDPTAYMGGTVQAIGDAEGDTVLTAHDLGQSLGPDAMYTGEMVRFGAHLIARSTFVHPTVCVARGPLIDCEGPVNSIEDPGKQKASLDKVKRGLAGVDAATAQRVVGWGNLGRHFVAFAADKTTQNIEMYCSLPQAYQQRSLDTVRKFVSAVLDTLFGVQYSWQLTMPPQRPRQQDAVSCGPITLLVMEQLARTGATVSYTQCGLVEQRMGDDEARRLRYWLYRWAFKDRQAYWYAINHVMRLEKGYVLTDVGAPITCR